MRSLTLGLSLASMLLSFQLSGQPSQQSISSLGIIEVVVRNSEDASIPQVSIQITGQSYTSTALHRDADGHWVESSGDARISVMAETDNTGRARFINIPPGLYQLQAARSGYLPRDGGTLPLFKADVRVGDKANPNAFPVSFEKHQLNPIVAIRMVEEGTIGGRVRDADGQPRSGIKVTVARLYTQNGVSRFSEMKSGETDDSGKYEVHGLRPGKYLARIDDNPANEIPDVQFADRQIYFPDARRAEFAELIDVHEGSMISGIDFSGSKAQDGVTISGVVTNAFPGGGRLPNGSLWRQISLSLVPAGEPLESRSTFYLKALKDNDKLFPFEIRSVPRGTYDLHATFMDSTWSKGKAVRYFSGKIRVVVSDEDLKGIRFEVETGIDVHGKLLIRDESAVPLSFESVAESQGGMEGVSFHSMIDNASLNPSIPESYFGSLENDGTFVLEALPSGRYEIDALTSILPFEKGKYCLQDIRQDGRSVFNDGVITVGRTAVSVQLDFNTGCTVVKGTVATSSEHRQFGVSVILVPELSHRANKALFKITSAGPDGSFTFEGVSSGNYKVFAFDANPRNEVMSFEFLSRYEASGTPISATSGTEMQPLRVSLIHLVQ